MVENRLTAWLRPVVTLFALAGLLSLAACGGGGGAPAGSPYNPAVIPTTLTVLPTTTTVFSGVPSTVTITAGTGPFQVFSSNPAILPVTQNTGPTIPLLAAQVNADTPVTLTILDATGQQASVAVTVSPSLLLPASITITGNPTCSGSGATLCSGQDGTATVVVTGPGGATLAGRSVRFDVVLGTFSLIAQNGTVAAQTVTVQTDQNGVAAVTIRVPTTAVSQFATLRATDVTSGSSVLGQFTISQFVNGNSVLSVIPTGTTTFTGPDTARCSSGAQANFYIFGGSPPYTVNTNFPTAINLIGSPVLASGGSFTVQSNGTCFTGLTFAITDSSGRTLLTPPLVDNVLGTAAPPTPDLTISPTGFTGACESKTLNFLATGGTGTYNAALAVSTGDPTVTVTGSTITAAFNATAVAGQTFNINVTSGTATKQITIKCT
jgi:hypothetical protein